MQHILKYKNKKTRFVQPAFTIIELAVIAPVVILSIMGFITTVVTLSGNAAYSRVSNQLSYNIQDALSLIEADVKYSTAFLEQNNITLTSPQGLNNDTTNFKNVTSSSTSLILNTYATTENPTSATGSFLYLANSPYACTSVDKLKNTVMNTNIVYFVSSNTLWRRTIMPANYASAGCATPWQEPSCAPGQTATFCKAQDTKVLDNLSTFSLTYYAGGNSDTALTNASDFNQTDAVRKTALTSADSIKVSLATSTTAGGKAISRDSSVRTTRNKEFITGIASAPTITGITAGPGELTVNFTAGDPGTSAITNYQYSTNGGANWTTRSPASASSPILITGLAGSTSFNVKIRAINLSGAGSESNQVTATTQALPF